MNIELLIINQKIVNFHQKVEKYFKVYLYQFIPKNFKEVFIEIYYRFFHIIS
jgi:hypothetical protein